MRNFWKSILLEERGSAAAEYALVVAIVGVAIVVAATNLGIAISRTLGSAAGYL